jgi:hypothetical protein
MMLFDLPLPAPQIPDTRAAKMRGHAREENEEIASARLVIPFTRHFTHGERR